jgi:hypothetical protein
MSNDGADSDAILPGQRFVQRFLKDIVHAKRKYLPYLNVNMIGKKLG